MGFCGRRRQEKGTGFVAWPWFPVWNDSDRNEGYDGYD
jgi:hypothetical protein